MCKVNSVFGSDAVSAGDAADLAGDRSSMPHAHFAAYPQALVVHSVRTGLYIFVLDKLVRVAKFSLRQAVALRSSLASALLVSMLSVFSASSSAADATCPPLLDHSFPSLQSEKPQSLCQWQGKVLLVVNTASFCGFTKQYDGLEKLYARLRDQGLVVIGFPTNDFGEQEPGSNKEIADFCRLTYGIQFPMFAKTTVKGPEMNPFFAELVRLSGTSPKWNFYKYLIDRSGKEVVAYSSFTDPDDKKLLAKIDELLKRR